MTDRQALEQIARITTGEDQQEWPLTSIQQIAKEALATPIPFVTVASRYAVQLAEIQAAAEPVRQWAEQKGVWKPRIVDALLGAIGKPENAGQSAPQAQPARVPLHDAVAATLLFHSETPWDEEKQNRWLALTKTAEATTKTLCDFLRAAISQPSREVWLPSTADSDEFGGDHDPRVRWQKHVLPPIQAVADFPTETQIREDREQRHLHTGAHTFTNGTCDGPDCWCHK